MSDHGHDLYTPEGWEGIAACRICNGGEASLPEHCPGFPMATVQQDDVQARRIDYRRERGWFKP